MPAEPLEIACDESGSEGDNLIGGETDVFAHASVHLSVEDARECVQEIRRIIGSPAREYKANHLLRTKHRAVLTWLLGTRGPVLGHAGVYLAEKSCHVSGVLAELFAFADPDVMLPEVSSFHRRCGRALDTWPALLKSFNDAMRARNRRADPPSIEPFAALVAALPDRTGHSEADELAERLRRSVLRLPEFRTMLLDETRLSPTLDPLIPAVVRAIEHWSTPERPVKIAHDVQIVLSPARIAALIARFTDHETTGGRLHSLRQVDSLADPRVQIADFLAGVARRIASEELNERGDTELTGLLRHYVDPRSVWGEPRSGALLVPATQPATQPTTQPSVTPPR